MEIINNPIIPHKGKAWHNKSHPYFTKQASNVVAQYIEHYSNVGDTICDPYGGTGVTAIEALRLKRKVIIMDINPLACFIMEQTCKKINLNDFANEFSNLEKIVAPQINEYYKLTDNEVNKLPITYWYPKNIRLPLNSDAEFRFVENLYTHRQLLSYSLLYHEISKISDIEMRYFMRYVFSSTMSKVNLTYMPSERNGKQVGGGGPAIFGKYRYWKPKIERELHVWENFTAKYEYIRKGKEKWQELIHDIDVNANLQVVHGSALEISKYIPHNSVDYIYTDPPYGGNIAYLDLSTMWNAWLFPEIFENKEINKLKQDEVIEGGDLNKTDKEYSDLFAKSFEEMGKVLKKDKWLSCVFAHKRLEYWNVIINSCEENGMEFKGSVYQPTNNSSMHWKQNPANVLCSQRIANFNKTFQKAYREPPDNLKKFIINEIERECIEKRGASIDQIYQRVLEELLRTDSINKAKKSGYLRLETLIDNDNLLLFEPETNLFSLASSTN